MGKADRETQTPADWGKHLRPDEKRRFHKKVRKARKALIKSETTQEKKHGR